MTGVPRKFLPKFIAGTVGLIWKLRSEAHKLQGRQAGVAAVEFAFILTLMLTIYFGVVVLSQGLEVGRKVQILSHTLADLTTQTLPQTDTTGTCTPIANGGSSVDGVDTGSVPCLTDSDFIGDSGIFKVAAPILYPFSNIANMTITEVVFDNVSTNNSACCRARVVWSVGFGPSPTLRSCGLLTQSNNGVDGPNFMPMAYYPGGQGDVVTSGHPYVASNNLSDYFVIVADVSYQYAPSFGFQPNQWNQPANGGSGYTITQTTYMNSRFKNSVTQSSNPAPTSPTTSNPRYDQLIYWTPDGSIGSSSYNVCAVGSNAQQYNLP
ncbi:TadE/TadG family type IV pilus assembly protein [Rhodoblastus sp.]|uniref:TadE/TadG family type IV pilus assembly protein n=1 Tax=Rhodoblastus sp. TaxID=1962975 RepID=UPI003F96D5E1